MARKSIEPSPEIRGRNRGEDRSNERLSINYGFQAPDMDTPLAYQERAIKRHESREKYADLYRLSEKRDQRAFARTTDMENEFYAGIDPRRRQELSDGGIVNEDMNAMANLPVQAVHHEYPQAGYYSTPYLDATMRGIGTKEVDDSNL